MAIEFKSNVDFDRIKREILEKQERELKLAINDAATEIVTRTRSQKDARGATFKALTPIYKKFKARKGRAAVPDLTYSGKMLASITSTVERLADGLLGRIFFSSQKEAEKARGNMKIRKFFELSKDQVNKIRNRLQGT